MLRNVQKLIFVAWLIWLGGCRMEQQRKVDTSQESRPNVLVKPHVALGAERVAVLRDRVASLKLGDLRKDVTALVGPFDREELMGPKTGRDWKCRGLLYYVIMVDETPGNANDIKVELVFDRQADRLVAVISNVDGIASRGDMAICR
jgi:hypothetical protein